MIIRINSLESKIEVFHEHYLHLHGFLKLRAEDEKNNKEYTIIIQILNVQTISDYIMTRQQLRNVEISKYIKDLLEMELQYVIQGRPIICVEKDTKTKKEKAYTINVFFLIEDLMEKGILKPHTMEVSAIQDDKAEYLKNIFSPDGIFMGTLASENNVNVYFPFNYLNYHFFIAGATGSGKSNLNQVLIDGLLQHNANVIMSGKGKRASMLAIDVHDEYALGCVEYGIYDIYNASENDKDLFGKWFYLYPNKGEPPAELKSMSEPCIINLQEIKPKREDYIESLLDDLYTPPGNHNDKTLAAVRRRLHWLTYSNMFQSNASSKLPKIIKKLEKGQLIVFNVSMISDLEQFLFNSVLARTLFDIRKALKSSTDFVSFEKKLERTLPKPFYDVFKLMMRHSNVFKDISRQGRKFNLALEVISQQYSPIDDTILSNMNTVINLPLRSEKEKLVAAKTLGGGIQQSDLESLTGTRGIGLISAIWLTNFQKLRIPLYDEYFKEVSEKFYENFANIMKTKNPTPPPTSLP